jgi:opacity protein-like surface antigen
MKYRCASAVLTAALTLSATNAIAADWGGVRQVGESVPIPVPPPAPVPTFDADSDWYVGIYTGGDVSQDADINNAITCAGCSYARDGSDTGAVPIFGFSFGRYITPSLRAEIAIDYHPDSQPFRTDWADTLPNQTLSGPGIVGTDTGTYNVHRTDIVRLARTTGLVNLLYDINTGTRFTPYVGGGVGFSWRRMKREYAEQADCISATNDINGPYVPPSCGSLPAQVTNSGNEAKDQINFAAALQAGIAVSLTDWVTWDNGWQMLWESNAIQTTTPTVSGTSTVSYKDAVLQQFRTGLRLRFD